MTTQTATQYTFPGISAKSAKVASDLLTDDNPTRRELDNANYSGSFATVTELYATVCDKRAPITFRQHAARSLSRALSLQEATGGKFRPGQDNRHLSDQLRTAMKF